VLVYAPLGIVFNFKRLFWEVSITELLFYPVFIVGWPLIAAGVIFPLPVAPPTWFGIFPIPEPTTTTVSTESESESESEESTCTASILVTYAFNVDSDLPLNEDSVVAKRLSSRAANSPGCTCSHQAEGNSRLMKTKLYQLTFAISKQNLTKLCS
jgi:hypothetical protein